MEMTIKRIVLAKIAGPHGIKGLVKIFPFGEDISLLETLPVFAGEQPVKITMKSLNGKFILSEIDIVKTREDAEKLSGTELWVNREDLPEIEEDGVYYYHDLIGLMAKSESGEEIGKVIGVDNYGAGDLLDIRRKNGQTFLHPYTDELVKDVDLEAGTITITELIEI